MTHSRRATTHPTHDDATRDTVRHLADQGLSNRAIARQTGVSEATVRRWRKDDAPDDAPLTRDDAPATPDDAPPVPDDALRIPRDADLRAHLAVLAEAGLSERQAIVLSMRFLATAVDDAWNHNVCPRGMLPTMRVQSIHPAARRPRLPIRP